MIKNTLRLITLCTMFVLNNHNVIAEEISEVYLKAQSGQLILSPVKGFDGNSEGENIAPYISLGVGYNLNDSLRLEFQIEHNKVTLFSKENSVLELSKLYLTLQDLTINNVSLNLYQDIYKIDDGVTIFCGVGVGKSQINETVSRSIYALDFKNSNNVKDYKGNIARKNIYNISYSFDVGFSYKANNHIHIETSYRYKDYGNSREQKVLKNKIPKQKYIAHIVTTGIKYSF
jgi:opacity protein-like surface antigen